MIPYRRLRQELRGTFGIDFPTPQGMGIPVRAVSVNRAWLIVGVVFFAMVCAHGSPNSLSDLIDAVIRKGPASQLPAHLSVVLGVSGVERPTAVKQAVMRDGNTVRTFNVSSANRSDVVMIKYNEQSRSSKAYLVSTEGKLRKAVSFQAGAPAIERSLQEARSDFAAEMKFWMDVEHQPAAPK
jgi:hypothetical protein